MRYFYALVMSVALLLAPLIHTTAMAGEASRAADTTRLPATQIATFSKQLENTLAQHGARVAIVARSGRPDKDLPMGVRYTHVAFAVYSMIEMENGTRQPGYAMYNLYQDAERQNQSYLVQDYPFDFFAAVPTLRSGIIIPAPELQQRLLTTITSSTYQLLHNPVYSLMANPHNNETQNCTEFTLNVLQASIYQTDDINFIKHTLTEHFSPYQVKINPLKLAAGALLAEGISLLDHPGPVQTATYGSILGYLKKFDLVQHAYEIEGSDTDTSAL